MTIAPPGAPGCSVAQEEAAEQPDLSLAPAPKRKEYKVGVRCRRCRKGMVVVTDDSDPSPMVYCAPCEKYIKTAVYGPFCLHHEGRKPGEECQYCHWAGE